ncbi:LLM class flavin-dependent oxidoreductase [Nocardioides nitrophenolicus]|uniref:LLM class flavin-dependent oxidoreductase n=1 Tax=Nocardioides nitrophenolicus TaxID=60489 RepID=UPI00195B0EBA|nr:LLM class flavin-dependent oxidoreductase [Nocardioides nitrophenolicus]MBM7517538.1 alkanesulfonate monooxygenase SsuD/methylene tetrahydromethanopterin reductase-like flavin-dependent oxidoreductase (luciferase family) [Nocardioides nitrophenolicus]
MTTIPPRAVLVELAVGTTPSSVPTVAEAARIAAAAEAAGVTALRLVDELADGAVLDPSVVAGFLGGMTTTLGYVVDVPTTRHAPYNSARRILSLDRAVGGRAGVALRPGAGDEVSEAVAPDPAAADPVERWAEYADVLARLWESFPAEALVGDQDAEILARDELIHPIAHAGRYYRVRGPLDGPSSVQGRPVQVVVDTDAIDVHRFAALADVVVVDRERAAGYAAALAAALAAVGRSREDVVLLGRVRLDRADLADPGTVGAVLAELDGWASADGLDGFDLTGDDPLALVDLAGRLQPRGGATLRAAFGLPPVAARLAPVAREDVA